MRALRSAEDAVAVRRGREIRLGGTHQTHRPRQGIAAVDLTGDAVTITAPDSSHIRVELAGYCTIAFDVDGFTASASSGQSCTFDIPSLGPQAIAITKKQS